MLLYLCMCFARGAEREGGNSWPQLHTHYTEPSFVDAAETAGVVTTPIRQAPGGGGEGGGGQQVEFLRVGFNLCQKCFY